jgi:hypothetical protein
MVLPAAVVTIPPVAENTLPPAARLPIPNCFVIDVREVIRGAINQYPL